ncbi:hypothetical protein A4X09_0g1031 [Tilletia walkeri]|uniref:Uncharacterized protein n=1 Tax=Tilletia walkeri TaxID=117179 RepID=A0A8X7T729_9BASI|nr:hypothetical protein A4X09_0g1031 [Tilletia walkeri]
MTSTSSSPPSSTANLARRSLSTASRPQPPKTLAPPEVLIIVRPPQNKNTNPLNLQIQLLHPPTTTSPKSSSGSTAGGSTNNSPHSTPHNSLSRRAAAAANAIGLVHEEEDGSSPTHSGGSYTPSPRPPSKLLRRSSSMASTRSAGTNASSSAALSISNLSLFSAGGGGGASGPTGSTGMSAGPHYFSNTPGSTAQMTSPFASSTSLSSSTAAMTAATPLSPSGSAFSTASSSTTLTSRGRSVTPLYNLHVHNILPTTVNDAATEGRVAKFGRKALDIDGLGSLEARPLYWGLNDLDTLQRQLELTVGLRTGLEPGQPEHDEPRVNLASSSSAQAPSAIAAQQRSTATSVTNSLSASVNSAQLNGSSQGDIPEEDEGTAQVQQPPTSFQAMTPEAQEHNFPEYSGTTAEERIAFPSVSPRMTTQNMPTSPIAGISNKLISRFKRFSINGAGGAASDRSVSPARSLVEDASAKISAGLNRRPKSVVPMSDSGSGNGDQDSSEGHHLQAPPTDEGRSSSPLRTSIDKRSDSLTALGRSLSSAGSRVSAPPFLGLTAPSMLPSASASSLSLPTVHGGELVSALVPTPPRANGERQPDGYYWIVRKWTPRALDQQSGYSLNRDSSASSGIGSKFSLRRRASEEALTPPQLDSRGSSAFGGASPAAGAGEGRRSMSVIRRSLHISEMDSGRGGPFVGDSSNARAQSQSNSRISLDGIGSGLSGLGAKLLNAAKDLGTNTAANASTPQTRVATAAGANPVLTAVWNKFHLHNRLALVEQVGTSSRTRERERESTGQVPVRSPSIAPSTRSGGSPNEHSNMLRIASDNVNGRRGSATTSSTGLTAAFPPHSPTDSTTALSNSLHETPNAPPLSSPSPSTTLIPHPPAESIELRFEWTREIRSQKRRKQREDAAVNAAKARVRAAAEMRREERRRSRRVGAGVSVDQLFEREMAVAGAGLAPSPKSQVVGLPALSPPVVESEAGAGAGTQSLSAGRSVGSKFAAACGGLATWSFGGGAAATDASKRLSVPSTGAGETGALDANGVPVVGVHVTPASPIALKGNSPTTASPAIGASSPCSSSGFASVASAAADILSHLPSSAAGFLGVTSALAPVQTAAAPVPGSVASSRSASAGRLTVAPIEDAGSRTPTAERSNVIDSSNGRPSLDSYSSDPRVGRPSGVFLDAAAVASVGGGGGKTSPSRPTSLSGTSSVTGGSGMSSDIQLPSHSDDGQGQGRVSPSAKVEAARQAAADKLEGASRRLNSRSEGCARTLSNVRSRWSSEVSASGTAMPDVYGTMGSEMGGKDEEDEEELSDQEDSERPWTCHLVLGPGVRIPLGTLVPAPHHPKILGQLAVPYPLPDLSMCGVGPLARGITREELKDVVSVTAMHLVVREGFGGIGKVPGRPGTVSSAPGFIPPGATALKSTSSVNVVNGGGRALPSRSLDLSSPAAIIAASSSLSAAPAPRRPRERGWRLSMGTPNSGSPPGTMSPVDEKTATAVSEAATAATVEANSAQA